MPNPKVRFKRENGTDYPDWHKDKWSDLGDFVASGTLSKADLSDAGTPCILYGELYTKYGEIAHTVYSKTNATSHIFSNADDVILPKSGETPEDISTATCIPYDNVSLGGDLIVFRHNAKVIGTYLSYLISNKAKNAIASVAQGKSVVHISEKSLSNIELLYPCVEEQQKIADFLSTVDEVIAQSEQEVQNLEQQKKAAMQKIFSQEVRFKREDGTEFPKWETVALGEIVEPNIIPVDNPRSNYVKLAVRSHCKGTFHKQITNESDGLDIDKMFLVEANNLIVNITFAWEHAIAITKPEDNGTYVSHRFPQYKFINNNLPSFYEHVIKKPKMKYEMGLCSPGGAGRNRVLNQKDFMKILMVRPCPEEQQKIADFLSAYDEAITYAKHELDKWKELKKGLLQQMFV